MNAALEPLTDIESHPVVSPEEWLKARRDLLSKEKLLTRLRDELSSDRKKLPWIKVTKEYTFDSKNGPVTLGGLFENRSQLYLYHFMFGPGWKEGCVGCSFLTDHLESTLTHLNNHDVSVAVVARAPLDELLAFKKRMGWTFNWVSSYNSDFNFDFNVSFDAEKGGKVLYNFHEIDFSEVGMEEQGASSAFYKNTQGEIFHTYSNFARGDEGLISTYAVLDIMPKGRNETGPGYNLTDWVRHHDRYGDQGHVDHTGRFRATEKTSGCECNNV